MKHPLLFSISILFLSWVIWKFILRNERRPHRMLYIPVMSQERWETSGMIRRRLEKIYGGWINCYEFNLYMKMLVNEGFVIQKETEKGSFFRLKNGHSHYSREKYLSFQNA